MTAAQRLESRLLQLQHQARKALGQNFLVSDTVIERILEAASNFNPEKVLEIGPGCGALTDLLREKFKELKLIELDRDLFKFWQTEGLDVINADALQIDWRPYAGFLLVSNLPYQISSSLVIERSLDETPLVGMVLMFQKEVAQRIRAVQQTEHYGMLSIVAQEFWQISTVCDAGPRDFKPPPKIASRVLQFKPRTSNVSDRREFLSFVKACFQQRRRILKTNLNGLNDKFDLNRLPDWLIQHKKSEKVRAEELSAIEVNSLYHFLKR